MLNEDKRRMDNYPDVLTPDEAMQVLSIGKNTIYKLLQSNAIKSLKIGKLYRIPKAYLQEFILSCYNDSCIDSTPVRAKQEGGLI